MTGAHGERKNYPAKMAPRGLVKFIPTCGLPRKSLKPFLCLLASSSDSVTFVNIELLTDALSKSSVRLDTSSFGLIGNAYASLCDSANLIISGSFSVSIGISFPFYRLSFSCKSGE